METKVINFADLVDLDERDWYDDLTEQDAAAEDDSQRWTIRDDDAAEWAVRKIAESDAEYDRLIECCRTQMDVYARKIEDLSRQKEERRSYLKHLLAGYFATVPHKESKTQESYTLPSGKLVTKHHAPAIIRDDEALADWCMVNGHEDAVTYRASVAWQDLKKCLIQSDKGFCTEDGEIVPGITLEAKPDTFEVKIGG